MKTFLKVLLIAVAVLVAFKLLPIALGLAFGLVGLAIGLGALGVSLMAIFVCVLLGVVALLSPIWIPVLAIVGLVALCRRGGSGATRVA